MEEEEDGEWEWRGREGETDFPRLQTARNVATCEEGGSGGSRNVTFSAALGIRRGRPVALALRSAVGD